MHPTATAMTWTRLRTTMTPQLLKSKAADTTSIGASSTKVSSIFIYSIITWPHKTITMELGNQNNPIDLDSSEDEAGDNDPVVDIMSFGGFAARMENGHATDASVVVTGRPQVQRRHSTGGGHVFDPSGRMKEVFKGKVLEMKGAAGLNANPVFDDGDRLFVKSIFRVPRPNRHFVGNRPGNQVRQMFQGPFTTCLGDVDNFSKFVLDALNGVMYDDDRQVAALLAIKCSDEEASNEGSTEMTISKISNDDLRRMMNW